MAPAPAKTFCEFFAGIGLVREALESSGWQSVYANDIDPKKRRQYQARFGDDGRFHLGDVRDTDAVLARLGDIPLLATASFPCVDLSLAGHYKGLSGSQSSAFFGFADVLDRLGPRRPPLVLLENVLGLVTSRGGADFRAVALTVSELGYRIDAWVLDAKWFVPQSRPRLFIFGAAHGVEVPGALSQTDGFMDPWRAAPRPSPIRPASLVRLMESTELPNGWMSCPLPTPTARDTTIRDVIDFDDAQEWWPEIEVERHRRMMSNSHADRVGRMMASGGSFVGTVFRRVREGTQRAEVRFDGVAGCLRTPRGGSARQIVLAIDAGRLRMRWMSPRECARLQGADDFPLAGTRTDQFFGFGDAVCVPVVRWIDRHVLTPALTARTDNNTASFSDAPSSP